MSDFPGYLGPVAKARERGSVCCTPFYRRHFTSQRTFLGRFIRNRCPGKGVSSAGPERESCLPPCDDFELGKNHISKSWGEDLEDFLEWIGTVKLWGGLVVSSGSVTDTLRTLSPGKGKSSSIPKPKEEVISRLEF